MSILRDIVLLYWGFFIDKADRKKHFCDNDGYELLLQPSIIRFNKVLRFRLRVAFFVFEDVLDL